ncbi:MAG: lipid-A-disaccharide synthase [Gammaproteobacteria bacterium]|nr:lipid-A-disaccharide synthase [Gammaproteobacteria bacterium]
MNAKLRIGIVAGEASGDLLGEGLIDALRRRVPGAVFEGIAGPRMTARGCEALYPMERLAVMGLVEVLGRYRELRAARARIAARFIADPPDVFVGIDAPDFNLGLEARLRAAGIPTVHYVSPTVWAWRRGRLRTIARAVDLMLTLFPFEEAFYREHEVAVRYVGHPLADAIPEQADPRAARAALGLPEAGELIALLPGSRESEVGRLADLFVQTAHWCLERRPGLRFVAPFASAATRARFEAALARHPGLSCALFDGRSREVMAAADAVLLASGTASLEAMLLKRPMVVAYRLAPLSHWLIRRMLYIDRYSLPNLLSGERLVPEFVQDAATPPALGAALLELLAAPERVRRLRERFTALHRDLRRDANACAAEAVLELVAARRGEG